jgi:hypothetical protein
MSAQSRVAQDRRIVPASQLNSLAATAAAFFKDA